MQRQAPFRFEAGRAAAAIQLDEDADAPESTSQRTLRFRTLWISDLHLGTPGCQAVALLDFLRYTE